MDLPLPTFNVLTDPWIPCMVESHEGTEAAASAKPTRTEWGIEQVLADAHRIVEIVGDTPLETIAIHRLLLAILHRTFGPATADEWTALWQRGRLDPERVTAYLQIWRHKFSLFHATHPFYQTVGLDPAKARSIANLQYQADNNPTLFDHAVTADPSPVSLAKAARLLVAFQSFDTTGTKTAEQGQESAQAAPLVQAAVVLTRGRTLFETLLLNLHRYSPSIDEEPWRFDASADRPAWERDAPTQSAVRWPKGYCDLLTWQSRRIWLEPGQAASGAPVVRRAIVMRGDTLPAEFERRGHETMVAYRARATPRPGESPWFPVGFREGRAAWRDSLSLVASLGTEASRPKMIQWLSDLVAVGAIPPSTVLRLELGGLAVDKAKCLFWRHERLSVPAVLLTSEDMVAALREALDVAERVARIVSAPFVVLQVDGKVVKKPSALRVLAACLVRQDREVPTVVHQLDAGRLFWGELEIPFQRYLHALPDDKTVDEFGNALCGIAALQTWRVEVRDAARAAFRSTTRAAGTSARALRAVAMAEREFQSQCHQIVGPTAMTPLSREEA